MDVWLDDVVARIIDVSESIMRSQISTNTNFIKWGGDQQCGDSTTVLDVEETYT